MKKIIYILFLNALFVTTGYTQIVSLRAVQHSYSNVDPDGPGDANGSVAVRFEIMPSAPIQTVAFAIGFLGQSTSLMPSGSPVTAIGALPPTWSIVSNLSGNPLNPEVTQGAFSYDRRIVIGFNQAATGLTMDLPANVWTPVCEVVYWSKSPAYPQAGNIIIEPGDLLPQNSIVLSDFETELEFQSPGFPANHVSLGSALPVTFASFSATCSPNGALVKWATEQESNSDYFEVQRSTNGNNWQTIGRTPAAGTSNARRDYNQIDLEAGNALYRIKQVDKDGRTTYTEVIRTNCEVKNVTTLLYPVPAIDYLNVVIKSDKAVRTQLMVYDITGKLVKRMDANVQNGTNNFRINLNGLSSGDYIIQSTDPAIQLNKKFTVVR